MPFKEFIHADSGVRQHWACLMWNPSRTRRAILDAAAIRKYLAVFRDHAVFAALSFGLPVIRSRSNETTTVRLQHSRLCRLVLQTQLLKCGKSGLSRRWSGLRT